MTATTLPATTSPTSSPLRRFDGTGLIVRRNYITYKGQWKLFATGFANPSYTTIWGHDPRSDVREILNGVF